jgi:PTS system ascorbate-specific IIA component
MAQLLIVAHAPLASSLRTVAQHAYPDCASTLRAFDVGAEDTPEDVERRLRPLLGSAETLILTDVFGATPCNGALRVADGLRTRVVAGINVPMLWRALCYAAEPLDRLVDRAVGGGTQGVLQASASRPQNQSIQPLTDDQVPHQHQQ